MPPKTTVTQEKKLISHSSQVEKSRKWQRSLTVTPLPASSSSNDGDSDWDETKRKQLKTAETVKDHNGLKKSVEVEKGKVLNAPKRHMSAYMLWLNATWEKIKPAHLGISIMDISKKAYKIWKGMPKEKKEEWDCKAEDTRREYLKSHERI